MEHKPFAADSVSVKRIAILVLILQLHWVCIMLPGISYREIALGFKYKGFYPFPWEKLVNKFQGRRVASPVEVSQGLCSEAGRELEPLFSGVFTESEVKDLLDVGEALPVSSLVCCRSMFTERL